MPTLPTPLRAALGLAATALDEARKLPETLPQVPVAAVTTAMQASLRVQQHIAALAARGDEVISQLRGDARASRRSWATFDESPTEAVGGRSRPTAARRPPSIATVAEAADSAPAAPVSRCDCHPRAEQPGAEQRRRYASPAAASNGQAPGQQRPSRRALARPRPRKSTTPARSGPGEGQPPRRPAPRRPAPPRPAPPRPAPRRPAPRKAGTARPGASRPSASARRSEPLADAARRAKPAGTPNPATMAAEIVQAHQADGSPAPGGAGSAPE